MFLKKLRVTSNGSRSISKLTSNWLSRKFVKQLNTKKLSSCGKSLSGQRIIRTKGALRLRIKSPLVAYQFRLKYPLLVSSLQLTPFFNKLLVLAILPSGGITYLPAMSSSKIFDIIYFRLPNAPSWYHKSKACITLVGFVQRYRKVSNFEVWPGRGIQYARSAGTSGKITTRDLKSYTALIHLPSGVRKIISIFSVVIPGMAANAEKSQLTNTKAGHRQNYGNKSINRGVARNPVDHPHGGRTKTVKYPRTPWGKTTKFK